jgi:hypothetical protein
MLTWPGMNLNIGKLISDKFRMFLHDIIERRKLIRKVLKIELRHIGPSIPMSHHRLSIKFLIDNSVDMRIEMRDVLARRIIR